MVGSLLWFSLVGALPVSLVRKVLSVNYLEAMDQELEAYALEESRVSPNPIYQVGQRAQSERQNKIL